MNTANLFACFGDIIELNFQIWDTDRTSALILNHDGWKQYNPRKPNQRHGLSVTSIDGTFNGIDLDSIHEYNAENQTNYNEASFKIRTNIVDQIPELKYLLDTFPETVVRSHFLKLDAGGFFPPHRDNGYAIPSPSFRIIVPLMNVGTNDWHWVHEGKLLNLEKGKTYCINTTKVHSVFSFKDNCIFLVLNITSHPKALLTISNHLAVK